MHQLGDILITKSGQVLLVLAETDVIKEDMTEILQTMEPIIITVPLRFTSFTKEGVLIVPQYSSMGKPMIAEYYNRVYIYQSEIKKEIGFVTNSQVLQNIANLMKNENLNLKEQFCMRKAAKICRTILSGLTQFQKDLQKADKNGILYH
jgi:hypothetical protein